MKVRILDNNIRLRLSQSEVNQIQDTNIVSAQTNFSGQPLEYEIVGQTGISAIDAIFDGSKISIHIPEKQLLSWANSNQVGFENEDQSKFRVLIEKDFQCLHKRHGEDETDNFPNPLADDEK